MTKNLLLASAIALVTIAGAAPAQACISTIKEKNVYIVNIAGKDTVKAVTGDLIVVHYNTRATRVPEVMDFDGKSLELLFDKVVEAQGNRGGPALHTVYFRVIGAKDSSITVKKGAEVLLDQKVETNFAAEPRCI